MSHLLCITSSPMSEQSRSRALLDTMISEWRGIGTVELIDLAECPPPMVSRTFVDAAYTPAEHRSTAMTDALAYSDAALAALRRADALAIAAPMHNFGPPANLKAWFDQVIRPGESFTMSGDRNQPFSGLLPDVPVALLTARGTSAPVGWDYLHPMVEAMLAIMGLASISRIDLQGTDEPGFDADREMAAASAALAGFARPFLLQNVA